MSFQCNSVHFQINSIQHIFLWALSEEQVLFQVGERTDVSLRFLAVKQNRTVLWITLRKSFHLHGSQFPHLLNGDLFHSFTCGDILMGRLCYKWKRALALKLVIHKKMIHILVQLCYCLALGKSLGFPGSLLRDQGNWFWRFLFCYTRKFMYFCETGYNLTCPHSYCME